MTPRPILITVLVVAYNHQHSIAASLNSVLRQKTEYPFVIWIAEDGSTDGTVDVCKQYARKYPKKIKLIAQPSNTKGEHVAWALSKIDTPYWTLLDGDDQWSDRTKLQMALSTLERHPEYTTFAHDTLYNDLVTKTKKSLVHDIHNANIINPVIFEEAPYLHTSSRVHRNIAGSRDHFRRMEHVGDLSIYYYFLDKGPLYYHDKIMSVYNSNGSGAWSSLSNKQQVVITYKGYGMINKMLAYRHDDFFTHKIRSHRTLKRFKQLLGTEWGWRLYMLLLQNGIMDK